MYVITGGRYHNKEATTTNKQYAIFLSEEKLEKSEMVDGELYKIVYQRDTGPSIGVLDNHYIRSGIGSTRHYNLIEKIEPTEISVKILNTDGKQKGRELVGENIGNTFPIIEVGPHDVYKYMVEIDGEKVALSLDNVMFYNPKTELDKEETFKFIKYRGVTLFIDRREGGVLDRLHGIDAKTNSTMYVYGNDFEVIDDALKVGINSSTMEFIDKDGLTPLYEDVVYDYGTKQLDFGLVVPVKRNRFNGRHTVFKFYATTKGKFETIMKALPKAFSYDKNNQVIYFNG